MSSKKRAPSYTASDLVETNMTYSLEDNSNERAEQYDASDLVEIRYTLLAALKSMSNMNWLIVSNKSNVIEFIGHDFKDVKNSKVVILKSSNFNRLSKNQQKFNAASISRLIHNSSRSALSETVDFEMYHIKLV